MQARFPAPAKEFLGVVGLDFWNLPKVHRPHCAANGDEVLRVVDLLMTKELSPGSVGSVAQVMGPIAPLVPTPCRLR